MDELSGPRTKPWWSAPPVGVRAALRRPFAFVIPAKSLPRTRYGAGIQSGLRQLVTFVIPAKAGIQTRLRQMLGFLVNPIRSHPNGLPPSGPRAHVPVRGAWESACGWEARWNAWLASPSSPMWRGDGEQSHRR